MRQLLVALAIVSVVLSGCADDAATTAGDTASTTSPPASTSTPASNEASSVPADVAFVHPGTDALTDRQVEMLEVLERYTAAWRARDGDLAASYMTEDAVFEYYEQGETYSVTDGSLQARISSGPYDTMRLFVPQMVYGNRIALTGTVDAIGVKWLSVIRFATDGDNVLIDKETLFYGP